MIFEIRPAIAEDASGLGYVHFTSWQQTYAGLISADYLASLSPEKSAEKFKQTGCKNMLVLTADSRIAGFSVYGATRDDDLPKTCGDIHAIYILKEFHKLGYGKKLLDASIEMLRSEGFTAFSIWVLESNDNAVAFYRKQGFVHDGKTQTVVYGTPVICKRYIFR